MRHRPKYRNPFDFSLSSRLVLITSLGNGRGHTGRHVDPRTTSVRVGVLGIWRCSWVRPHLLADTDDRPAVGPILGGYIYSAGGWRCIMWALLALNGLLLLWMVFMMPETSGAAVCPTFKCR
jgi:hypothetical protein